MKKHSLKLTMISLTFVFFACSGNKNEQPEANYLPNIKAEIPVELQDNEEIVKYITATTDALNESSRNLEDLYVKVDPFAKKDENDLSTMEKLKLTKYTLEFAAQMAKVSAKFALMEESYQLMSEDLTEDEAKALEIIQMNFIKRIEELNNKYKDLNKIEIEQDEITQPSDSSMSV